MFDSPKKKLKKYFKKASKYNNKQQLIEWAIQAGWTREVATKLYNEALGVPEVPPVVTPRILPKIKIEIADEAPKPPKIERPLSIHSEQPKGLSSQIKDINEKLELVTNSGAMEKKLKKKSFKMPWKVKSQMKKLAKQNKAQIMYLRRNRTIEPTIGTFRDGMLYIGEKIYSGDVNGVWLWQGKFPTMIIKEWDLHPVTPTELYDNTLVNKSMADPQGIIIRGIESKEALIPKKLGGKSIIFILIGAAVVAYVLFMRGK